MPVPASSTIRREAQRTSTHDVLPPHRTVASPGVATEPRVPQNLTENDVSVPQSNSWILRFRNSTLVPCPSNPICPLGLASPGCFLRTAGSRTESRFASTIVVPFNTTLINRPLAVISSRFHSPVGFLNPC